MEGVESARRHGIRNNSSPWDERREDNFHRKLEVDRELYGQVAQYAQKIGSMPLVVLRQFSTEWAFRHRNEIGEDFDGIDYGQPSDHWVLPEDQQAGMRHYAGIMLGHLEMGSILKYAVVNGLTPAEVVAQIINEGFNAPRETQLDRVVGEYDQMFDSGDPEVRYQDKTRTIIAGLKQAGVFKPGSLFPFAKDFLESNPEFDWQPPLSR